MLKTLKALIGIHHKSDASTAEIERALGEARAEITAAEHAHADAEAAYRAGLLRLNDADAQKLVADKQAAILRRDRAAALVEALTEKLAHTQHAEDQADRRQRYQEAAQAQEQAAQALGTNYPKLARSLAELLRTVAEADALVARANAALPAIVTEPLSSVENRVRRESNVPGRVIRDEVFDAWCFAGGRHVHADDQGTLKPNPDGRTGMWKPFGDSPAVPVTLRRFRRVTSVPDTTGRGIASLASTLNLPPLGARHIPFWPAGAASSPAGILAWLDENAPAWGQPFGSAVLYDPDPHIEIIPLDPPADRAA